MSNIDKQALREEFKMMQDCYSDPADRDRQVIYLAAEALLDELEATYSRIGELEVIATDYGMKFQRAQDALKHQSLLHKSQLEAAEKTSAARLGAIDTTHKMFRRERDRADTAEKRIAELEAREVKLPERYEVEMCPTPSPDGDWYSREDVLAALKTAGIHTRGED